MPKPTQDEIELNYGLETDNRTLAVNGVNSKFLKRVNMEATDRGMTVKDLVIESILKNSKEWA